MGKRTKANNYRSKIREQRELRLKAHQNKKIKQKENKEFFDLITQENIDKLETNEKISTIENLNKLLISYPDSNYDKISLMILFMKDNNLKVIIKSIKMLKNIFLNRIPSFRINEIDSKQKESKEISEIHNNERNLLISYVEYINNIKILDRNFYKQNQYDQIRKIFTEILSEFFEKFYYFNYEEKLYSFLIEKLCDYLDDIKKKAFLSLFNVLAIVDNSNKMFNLKLNLIKRISNVIFSKDHSKFDKNVLDLFTAHKIFFPDYKNDANDKKIDLSDLKYAGNLVSDKNSKTENIKAKKQLNEFNKEKSKIIKSIKKEMREIESKDDPKLIFNMNLKILKKILLVYFDIIKNKQESPLLISVFNGIGKLCENINVEILIDLQKNIFNLINNLINKNKIEIALFGLKANYNITKQLTKEIVSIEDSYLITSSYQILCYLIDEKNITKENLYIICETLELILLKNRIFSVDTSAAFVKRLSMLCNNVNNNENFVVGILLLIKRILSKYSNLSFLIDSDEDFDNFDYKNKKEPELCNGKLTNILGELNEVKNKCIKNKMICKLIEYIIKEQKVNSEFNSLNFYDFILK